MCECEDLVCLVRCVREDLESRVMCVYVRGPGKSCEVCVCEDLVSHVMCVCEDLVIVM